MILSLSFFACARDNKERDLIFSSCANVVMFKDMTLPPNSPKVECRCLPPAEIAKKIHLTSDVIDKISNSDLKCLELNTSGFRPYDLCTLYVLGVNFDKNIVGEFLADKEGVLVPIKTESLFIYSSKKFMKGEPLYYVFMSEDKKTCVATFYVPNPIEYKWQDGAVGSMTMLTGDALLFSFVINGFQPNEKFTYRSKAYGQKTVKQMTAGPDGKSFTMLIPTADETGGYGTITIDRQNSTEQGIFNYYWGKKGIHMMMIHR